MVAPFREVTVWGRCDNKNFTTTPAECETARSLSSDATQRDALQTNEMRGALAVTALLAAAAAAAGVSQLPHRPAAPLTDAPVIGILSVPITSVSEPCQTLDAPARSAGSLRGDSTSSSAEVSLSCFAAFYAQWLQAAGARVVALPYNAPPAVLDALLSQVNGVLFTGGELGLNFSDPYTQAAFHIYSRVLEANDGGVYMPLHGTCMGMQLLSVLSSWNQSVLHRYAYDAENISLPLDVTAEGKAHSRLLAALPQGVVNTLTQANATLNLHHDGVPPADFATSNLTDFWWLVSTNTDRVGKAFVSTLEAKAYPITATQWHPERPQFEFKPGMGINHSPDVVAAMWAVSSFVVNEARYNGRSFNDTSLFNAWSVTGNPPQPQGPLTTAYAVYRWAL